MRFLSCVLLIVFQSHVGLAAFSNFNSILVGDLASGLSGAGTSIEGDISSASFYNPALIAAMKGQSFSAAVGIYKKFDTIYNQKEDILAAPLRVNKGYFRSLPSATGQIIDFHGYKLALSIVTPDYDQFSGKVFSEGTRTKNLNYTDESLWVGGSIAKEVDESRRVGVTFYYTARNLTKLEIERDVPSATELSYRSLDKIIKENSLVSIIGYHEKLNEKWNWGVSLRTTLFNISGKGELKETLLTANAGSVTLDTPESSDIKTRQFIPARLNLGFSYRPSTDWLWSFDINTHEGFKYYDLKDSGSATLVHNRLVTNASFGAEKDYQEWLKFRAGIFTNFSAHPDPDPNLQVEQMDHVDMLGFSANVSLISEKKIAYTFGGYYSGGWGRSLQKNFNDFEIVSKKHNIFTMLVGTSFFF